MRQKKGLKKLWWLSIPFIGVSAYAVWVLLKPLPAISPTYTPTITAQSSTARLAWPSRGHAALSIPEKNILATHGEQKPAPMASTAKVITALMVLNKKPLSQKDTGPKILIKDNDVAIYQNYVRQDGSVLKVSSGTVLTEYQMLQALMLPSANNIADTLAIWSYGSLKDYAAAANAYLKSQGINHTHVGSDASGLSPDTTTTAEDLVKIGKLALENTVLSEIVNQKTATGLPLNPVIKNVNYLLGQDGIIGIKTGNSDEAGGAFLGAAKKTVNGQETTFISAVVAESNLYSALSSSQRLIRSAENNFETSTVIKKGAVLGTYAAPWGEKRTVVAAQGYTTTNWRGEKLSAKINLKKLGVQETDAGSVSVSSTAVSKEKVYKVSLNKPFTRPTILWRLTHPVN